jgi:hypothetical protein
LQLEGKVALSKQATVVRSPLKFRVFMMFFVVVPAVFVPPAGLSLL